MYSQVFSVANTMALSGTPSLGALLGTSGSRQLLDSINQGSQLGVIFASGAHGDDAYYNQFMTNFIQPLKEAETLLNATAAVVLKDDQYIPRTTVEELEFIPQAMHIPILMMPEVQALHQKGMIDGFGYKPENMPDEDTYGRICETNGVLYSTDPDDAVMVMQYYSTDPDLSLDDMDAICETREFVRYVVDVLKKDPTCITDDIGKLKD